MNDTASNSKQVKMNFNFEDPNIAERLHEVEKRYPVGCLPQSLTTPSTDKAKRCLFEKIDSSRSNYRRGANMEAFRTTQERIQPWLKALHLYYIMSCEDTRTVDFVDTHTPFEISSQHLLEKVTADVKDIKTKKKIYKVTFFIKSGLIQVQGTSYHEFMSKDFPLLLDIVQKICGPLELTVHQSNEETTTTNKSDCLRPHCMDTPQNRHDQPSLQAVHKTDNFDVKLRKSDALRDITNHNDLRVKEGKAFHQPANFQHGEPLRKTDGNSFPCQEALLIYNQEKLFERIGCIKVTLHGKESHGTGFRVGSKYFMTAFHVMEDVLILFWEEVYRRLTKEERMQMKWTDDKIPVDGAWKLSKLLTFVDPSKRKELIEIGKQFITNHVHIKFGFVRDCEYSSLAQCSYEVAFVSPSHDVVILELIEDTNLPNPFHLKTINAAATKLHLIGHPGGRKLEHDPACKIIKDQKELENLVKEGISFFTSRGCKEDQVKEDYKPCILSPDHLLFHCSESITHGASGSPLIVIINEKEAQVIGMLLRGHPKFYYNYDKRNGVRLDLLVESGISMEKVNSLLICHSLHDLAANLFPEQL